VEVDRPFPDDLGDGQVLVRTTAGGLCGSDLPYVNGHVTAEHAPADPRWPDRAGFPMHEMTGTVVASRSPGLAAGDEVVGWATPANGLAEYVVTDGAGLCCYDRAWPASTAVLLQPLACVLYAVGRLGDVEGASVAVIGLGSIGVLFGHTLRAAGAARLVGVDPVDRSGLAATFGFDVTVAAPSDRWLAGLAADDRPDIVVEAAGHQAGTLNDAVNAVTPGGRIYYFGIPEDHHYPFDLNRFLRKGLTLRAGLTRRRREMLGEAGRYLAAHRELASAFVTDVFPIQDVAAAFDRAQTAAPERVKVTLTV
jgi:threonine dehydrogenase-like Zn-dependent dehydrogenase